MSTVRQQPTHRKGAVRVTRPDASVAPSVSFDHFCFEAMDGASVILNYVGLKPLLQAATVADTVAKVAVFVQGHMVRRQSTTFTVHLFCNGMPIRDIAQLRTFMVHFAKMFRTTFPTELDACYIYNAPRFFDSIYELFKPIMPKASRDKIVLTKTAVGVGPGATESAGDATRAVAVTKGATADATGDSEPRDVEHRETVAV
jgi:hypothetical protein